MSQLQEVGQLFFSKKWKLLKICWGYIPFN
jgi:hypothetical protein